MSRASHVLAPWLIGAACCILLSPTAHAWNSIGHMAIGKLAFEELSDAHKARLFGLLQKHPHYDRYLAAGKPPDVSAIAWAIVRCGVWPDWIRPRKQDMRGVVQYHRGEEHYINV